MGTYSTTAKLIELLGENLFRLLDVDDGSDISANAEILRDIAVVDSDINDHLRSRYEVPLAVVPISVESIAADLVFYRLLRRRTSSLAQDDIDAYNDALRRLRDIRDGKNILKIPVPNEQHDLADLTVVEVGADILQSDTRVLEKQEIFRNY